MKRFIKQKSRSYRYDNSIYHNYWLRKYVNGKKPLTRCPVTISEVHDHVLHSVRPDADVIFNEVAHQAAANGLLHCYTGSQGVCFMQPTTHPRGYFSLLKLIDGSRTLWRQDLIKAWNAFPMTTMQRLIAGKLVAAVADKEYPNAKKKGHFYTRYVLTDLGKAYLKAAEKYVVKRSQS